VGIFGLMVKPGRIQRAEMVDKSALFGEQSVFWEES